MTDREETARRARTEIEKLKHEGDTIAGASSALGRARAHFSGRDDASDGAIEIWGKRIGRVLSAIVFVALAIYLFKTHVR